jgi:hypothetical protein
MTIQLFDNVMSPEIGVEKSSGGFGMPGMGGPPGRAPRGMGGPPPGVAAPPASAEFAKRPETLAGKTVYLVDTGFGGSFQFMRQLQKWFGENMPSVKTVRKRKPGNVFMDDNNELWEEIKQKGDAVVLGVAG